METDTKLVVAPKQRRQRPPRVPPPPDQIVEQPCLRVTRSRIQVTLSRDAMVALGRPTHVAWIWREKEKLVRITSVLADTESSYCVTYSARPSAIVTLPPALRHVLAPGKYTVVSWGGGTEGTPHWLEIPISAGVIKLSTPPSAEK